MNVIARCAGVLLVLLSVAAPDGAAQAKIIRFGTLWDGSRVLNDAVVVVEGDRITRVASGADALPPGGEVIDLRRYAALPGLIDLHTHTHDLDVRPEHARAGMAGSRGSHAAKALAAATTTAAELLGLQDRLGRIAPGYLADVVAVEADPLQRIDALFTGVRWAMKDGKVVVDRR